MGAREDDLAWGSAKKVLHVTGGGMAGHASAKVPMSGAEGLNRAVHMLPLMFWLLMSCSFAP
jgi:hypothetical protein